MTAAQRTRLLRRLAALAGVETTYRSMTGAPIVASVAALEGVLRALGDPVGTDAELVDATAARTDRADRLVAPVTVCRTGAAQPLALGPVASGALGIGMLHLRDERGGERSLALCDLAPVARRKGWTVDLGGLELEVGYYSATIETPEGAGRTELLVRPGKARPPERSFGLFAPLYGLRSARDWGIGSTSELAALGRWAGAHGAAFVGTLPLYPAFYDRRRFEVSPYRPVSRVAWNEIYLDPVALPEVAASPDAMEILSSSRTRRAVRALRRRERVAYDEVFALKREVLAACASAVEHGPRRAEFAAYLAAHPETKAYALFRADRDGGTADERWEATRYHQYCQFAMGAALGDVVTDGGLPLYLDLPLGVHPEGFDPAHYPSSFLSGASVGAPPDDFFVGGQVWGIPPLHPEGIRDGGFAYVTATLRHVFRHASVVRIDHVMAMERCFVVPNGASPADGAYLRYPSTELRAIAAIEAQRGPVSRWSARISARCRRRRGRRCAATGCSTRPSTSWRHRHRTPRRRHRLGRSQVSAPTTCPASPRSPPGATSPTGWSPAHSTVPVRPRNGSGVASCAPRSGAPGAASGAWRGAYRGVLAWLGSTAADLALVDLGDLVGDGEPENRPGPASGGTSWRHRSPIGVEELAGDRRYAARLATVAAGREGREGR